MKLLSTDKALEIMHSSQYPQNHSVLLKFERGERGLPFIGQKIRRRTLGKWRLIGILPLAKKTPTSIYDIYTIANPKIGKRDNVWFCSVDKIEKVNK